jgi:hypothetical protein
MVSCLQRKIVVSKNIPTVLAFGVHVAKRLIKNVTSGSLRYDTQVRKHAYLYRNLGQGPYASYGLEGATTRDMTCIFPYLRQQSCSSVMQFTSPRWLCPKVGTMLTVWFVVEHV